MFELNIVSPGAPALTYVSVSTFQRILLCFDLSVECNDFFADKIGYYKTSVSYNKTTNDLYELIAESTPEPPPPTDYMYLIGVVMLASVFLLAIIGSRKRKHM